MSSLSQSQAAISKRESSAQREIMQFREGEEIEYSFETVETIVGHKPRLVEATFRVTKIDRPNLEVSVELFKVTEGLPMPARLDNVSLFVFVPSMSEGSWTHRDRKEGQEPFTLWLGPEKKSLYHNPIEHI